jgi:glycosyltransferase involved in cell wall biosynthesis
LGIDVLDAPESINGGDDFGRELPFYGRTVAVVEWRWVGHHPTYYVYFVKTLLELGVRVIAAHPFRENLKERLVAEGLDSRHFVRLVELPFQRRRFLIPTLSLLGATVRTFGHLHRLLSKYESLHRRKVDLVFFACIYEIDFWYFKTVWKWIKRPWSGLYLHCRAFRKPNTIIPLTKYRTQPERFLSEQHLSAVALLDEYACEWATWLCDGKPAISLPDLANLALPPNPSKVACHILERAKGRKIVVHLGHMQQSKGSAVLAEIAHRDFLENCFYVFVGDVNWSTFEEQQQSSMRSLEKQENVFVFFDRLESESDLNELIHLADVCYAAYIDFPNSSNILTKCAGLRCPIVVSEGYLMADRVKAFNLGLCVPECNVDASVKALRTIIDQPNTWYASNAPRWEEFTRIHSQVTLSQKFAELLSACSERSPCAT